MPPSAIQVITGGDGVPSPQKSRQSSNHITDFDDDEDESDGTDTSEGSNTGAAAPTPRTAAAKAAASAAETALSKLAAAKANDGGRGGGGGDAGMWLLDRPEALEDAYLQLTHSLGQHNQRAGRSRAAARCWGRRVELLLERGEVGVAQARLSALADLYQVRLVVVDAVVVSVRSGGVLVCVEEFFMPRAIVHARPSDESLLREICLLSVAAAISRLCC